MGELLKQFDGKPPASTLTIPAHFHEAITDFIAGTALRPHRALFNLANGVGCTPHEYAPAVGCVRGLDHVDCHAVFFVGVFGGIDWRCWIAFAVFSDALFRSTNLVDLFSRPTDGHMANSYLLGDDRVRCFRVCSDRFSRGDLALTGRTVSLHGSRIEPNPQSKREARRFLFDAHNAARAAFGRSQA
jgi:hypothetical protein